MSGTKEEAESREERIKAIKAQLPNAADRMIESMKTMKPGHNEEFCEAYSAYKSLLDALNDEWVFDVHGFPVRGKF